MRQLVTVRRISKLTAIPGADLIELATVDGWKCVVKKGEFKVGDDALYFEIDSFLPASDPRFKFLEKTFTHHPLKGHLGARIRTIKLRGEVSQGLLLPTKSFPELEYPALLSKYSKDFSDQVGVIKWEPKSLETMQHSPNWLGKAVKKLKYKRIKPFIKYLEKKFPGIFVSNKTRPFPSFIPKTDEERIQNLFNKLSKTPFDSYVSTVKLDGSSMTVYKNQRRTGVCSRNFDLKKESGNRFWETAIKYRVIEALKKLGRNLAIQGELMGPGIQGNREGLPDYRFYVFKIYDIDQDRFLPREDFDHILHILEMLGYKLDTVPVIESHVDLGRFETVEAFLAYAEGPSLNAKTREGVVFMNRDGTSSFKAISNSFLLEKGAV